MADSKLDSKQQLAGAKKRVVVSPSLIKFNPSTYVYNPRFDLGIGEEWLPKHPVIKPAEVSQAANASIGMQYHNDDDTFWCSFGAMKDVYEQEENSVIATALNESTGSPAAKRSKLSMSLKKDSKAGKITPLPLKDCSNNSKGFGLVSSPDREKASKGVVPAKTEANSQWAFKNFMEWSNHRNLLEPHNPVPKNLLECHDADLVCKWLCRYLLETRKTDGSHYPPASLRSLICGLNRTMQGNQVPFCVLSKDDP